MKYIAAASACSATHLLSYCRLLENGGHIFTNNMETLRGQNHNKKSYESKIRTRLLNFNLLYPICVFLDTLMSAECASLISTDSVSYLARLIIN